MKPTLLLSVWGLAAIASADITVVRERSMGTMLQFGSDREVVTDRYQTGRLKSEFEKKRTWWEILTLQKPSHHSALIYTSGSQKILHIDYARETYSETTEAEGVSMTTAWIEEARERMENSSVTPRLVVDRFSKKAAKPFKVGSFQGPCDETETEVSFSLTPSSYTLVLTAKAEACFVDVPGDLAPAQKAEMQKWFSMLRTGRFSEGDGKNFLDQFLSAGKDPAAFRNFKAFLQATSSRYSFWKTGDITVRVKTSGEDSAIGLVNRFLNGRALVRIANDPQTLSFEPIPAEAFSVPEGFQKVKFSESSAFGKP